MRRNLLQYMSTFLIFHIFLRGTNRYYFTENDYGNLGVFRLGWSVERGRKYSNLICGEREVDLWTFTLVGKLQR